MVGTPHRSLLVRQPPRSPVPSPAPLSSLALLAAGHHPACFRSRAAMVLWNDSDISDDSVAEYISSCGSPIKIPATIEDPNYAGVDDDLMVICENDKPTDKLAAFEGISTGRRFLACSLDQASNCGIVHWVDEEWPEHLQNALHKLCLMITYRKPDHQKDVENITISVDSSMGNMKERLLAKDVEISKLKVDVEQLKFIHVAQGNCIRNMKHNHLKEKEKMGTVNRTLKFCWANLKKEKEKLDGCIVELMKDKEKWSIEKTAMECCIADLKKAGENNKRKLKDIKCIVMKNKLSCDMTMWVIIFI
ncbi:hypothetical protein D1007_24745 [Hordeum vulgare]|nr:hypothetical protein D1007_24745 [Hordeum vulgare]